ncbi:MAG: VOC family protein [Anaerolineales bacterium]|nr:VOC family protein [Anaerolineales bacterium]
MLSDEQTTDAGSVNTASPIRQPSTTNWQLLQTMNLNPRYVHTNLIAEDWQALARFYQELFDCVPVPPERDFMGEKLSAGTGIPGARLRGVHLRLPGYGDDGPTLEIFNYNILREREQPAVNRPGFGHIAFSVTDVGVAREAVLQAGGRAVGEIVTLQLATGAQVTWCYVTDPEGNVIELQSWSG